MLVIGLIGFLLDRGMAPVDCAIDRIEPFYDALRRFLQLIDRDDEGNIIVVEGLAGPVGDDLPGFRLRREQWESSRW